MTDTTPAPGSTQVSSPVATGAGGTVFEQHVNTAFLSLLLVRGIPPVIFDCSLSEVHFQTEHLGWRTDDVLLVGIRGDSERRCLALQVKRSFTVSATDDECRKAFQDSWQDFHNPAVFDPTRDGLALVVQRGTNVLLEGLGALLDCARASKDAADFAHRLVTPGLLSKKSIEYANIIRDIIVQVPKIVFSEESFWAFLRVLHLLSLDLATSTSQTEAWVKTMLAHTSSGHEKQAAASQTWTELVEYAGRMMPQAASIRMADLPETVRNRHAPIAGSSLAALDRLRAHSHTVFRGIRTTLAEVIELPREKPIAEILERLTKVRAVLVTGPAGFGKSALAKRSVEKLAADSIILAFRAEEFASTHLDQTLHNAEIGAGSEELFALLAGQGRKVIQVEGVERLLESSQRDAFLDLLRLVADDPSWGLVLTCRDYSVETVRAAFLEHAGLPCDVFDVPELTDQELAQAVDAIPSLHRPASHDFLNKLFRNPYYLDKAAAMSWPSEATLPADERSFRDKFWREVVRQEHQTNGGMPKRREQAFIELCVRRAKALEPFARCDDLDREALSRLRADSLITYAEQTDTLAAPSHDALEDWAVVRWIEETFVLRKNSRADFAAQLGSYPAIRRAYRKWLSELLDASPSESDAYVTSIIQDTALPAHFRDDTLVSSLLSPVAADFLNRAKALLVQNDCFLLRRVIHLTRVACKTAPPWIRPVGQGRAIWFVPCGPAWPAVLRLVREEFDQLAITDIGLVVGLLTDWSAGVSVASPHPDGMQDAAKIAHHLLPHLDHYSRRDAMEEVLKVIVKIPMGDEQAFAALAHRASLADRRDHLAKEFAELILTGIEGTLACMDAPDVVVALASAYFKERAKRGHRFDHLYSLEMERLFGLNEHLHLEFSQSSAIRGPFLPLLHHHPAKGVEFILDLLNHACESFAQRHGTVRHVASPWEVTLSFPDGTTRRQWCEDRLWGLYRGTSVGPDVLQCALMAVETWLLGLAELKPEYLEQWLIRLLRESNNVALTAVVASVAVAFPHAAGQAALMLLSCRDLILLDRGRLVQDSHPPSLLFDYFPTRGGESWLYAEERRQSDRREHRKRDLEWLAIALAAGPLTDRVYAILDAHRAALPPEDQQKDKDRVWRLALHRMDLRRYEAVEEAAPDQSVTDVSRSSAENVPSKHPRRIVMAPRGLEPDLEEFIQQDAPQRQRLFDGVSLFMWADCCFRREAKDNYRPEEWRRRLAEAQSMTERDRTQLDADQLVRSAPGLVAAVCVRDHWCEMDQAEQHWSVSELVSAVRRNAEQYELETRISRSVIDSSRPAAYILPLILTHELTPEVRQQVCQTIAVALTHPCDEVVTYAAEGIGAHLVSKQPAFVLSCVRALAAKACWIQELEKAQSQVHFEDRLRPEQLQRQVQARVTAVILSDSPCSRDDLLAIDLDDWWGRDAMSRILAMLRYWPENQLTRVAFELVAGAVVHWWGAGRDRTAGRQDRNHYTEDEYLRRLAEFCLRLPPADAVTLCRPILEAVDHYPDDVEWFVTRLIIAEDQLGEMRTFWALWREFAKRVVAAPWLKRLDTGYKDTDRLLSVMFLGVSWKEGVRHWRCLDGFSQLLDQFFEALPAKPMVFRYYAQFLNEIGERSLPQAFVVLSRRLHAGDAQQILSDRSVAFLLECMLRRYVYSRPSELKSRQELRDAVLHVLDELVTAGSSAAYRMRDDFVTPGSPVVSAQAS